MAVERVLRTLEFKPTDRAPVVGGMVRHPEFLAEAAGVSLAEFWKDPRRTAIRAFRRLGADLILGLILPQPDAVSYGPLANQGQVRFHSPEDVRDYAAALPSPESVSESFDADAVREAYRRTMRNGQRACGGMLWIPSGIHTNCAVFDFAADFGNENYLMALTLYPEALDRLFARDAERAFLANRAVAEATRSDGLTPCVWTGTDICDNRGPVVDPALLEQIYFPRLRRSLEPLHEAGLTIIWHADGNIMPLAPRLLECGVDGFQGFQEKAGTPVDVEALSEMRTRRGRKPVLIGSVPTTTTLPFGTPDDVRREVARCVALARRRGGGFLLNASSSVGPEVPKENLYALFESAAAFPREASAMQDKPVAPSWTAPA